MRAVEIGPTVPIHVACSCPAERTVPMRLVSDTLAQLRQHLRGRLPASTPVLTYRCRHCKQIVVITAGQLYLSDAEQLQMPLAPLARQSIVTQHVEPGFLGIVPPSTRPLGEADRTAESARPRRQH